MKLYYIADKAVWQANVHLFNGSHHIDLPDGIHVLMGARFHDEGAEYRWSQLPGVEPLPHPLSGQPVSAAHHNTHLKAAIGTTGSENTFQVAELAKLKHPLLAMTVF